jgi:hypothetical protein
MAVMMRAPLAPNGCPMAIAPVTLRSRWAVKQRNAQRHPGIRQHEIIPVSLALLYCILDLAHRAIVRHEHAMRYSREVDEFDNLGMGPIVGAAPVRVTRRRPMQRRASRRSRRTHPPPRWRTTPNSAVSLR